MMGEKILRLRKARGWSQEELASRLGVTRQAVGRWESGTAKPDADKIIDLCDLFGVSADYLLRDNYAETGLSSTAPETTRASGLTAMQIFSILLIVTAVLLFCSLCIMSALDPHSFMKNRTHYDGLPGYIMSQDLWWLVAVAAAALLGGIIILLQKELRKFLHYLRS